MEDRITVAKQKSDVSKKSYKKKSSKKNIRKQIRNSKRRVRRKQNRVKYYNTLKQIRYQNTTEDICSQVEVFDIGDMDWTPMNSSNLPPEVIDWHKQDQIAYWKSRAISLELENKMLKKHLRNVYAQGIEDFSNEGNSKRSMKEQQSNSTTDTNKEQAENEESHVRIIPNVPDPDLKNRLTQLKNIFGNKAEKIMGMETAVQLNYERHLEQDQAFYWPSIPLKIVFE